MTFRGGSLGLVLLLVCAACSSGSAGGPGLDDGGVGGGGGVGGTNSGKRVFAQTCQAHAECEAGLLCAQSGFAPNTCSMSCEDDGECTIRYGTESECLSEVCVLHCVDDSSCPSGSVCHKQMKTCGQPVPEFKWTCVAEGGVCVCDEDPNGSTTASCPFGSSPTSCCSLGGPSEDPSTWKTCVCQTYDAIPSGDNCYTLPVKLGISWGRSVESCPNGESTSGF